MMKTLALFSFLIPVQFAQAQLSSSVPTDNSAEYHLLSNAPFQEIILEEYAEHPTGAAQKRGMMYIVNGQVFVVPTLGAPVALTGGPGAGTKITQTNERTERALIYCSSASTEKNVSSGWIRTAGNRRGDECSVTLVTGVFASAPVCVASLAGGKSGPSAVSVTDEATVRIFSSESDYVVSLICSGPSGT